MGRAARSADLAAAWSRFSRSLSFFDLLFAFVFLFRPTSYFSPGPGGSGSGSSGACRSTQEARVVLNRARTTRRALTGNCPQNTGEGAHWCKHWERSGGPSSPTTKQDTVGLRSLDEAQGNPL